MTSQPSKLKIFAGSESQLFAQQIATQLQLPLGQSQVIKFSDGNIFVELQESVQGQTVVLVQSIANNVNESFLELLFWLDACHRGGATEIITIIPYFSYAKSDKPDGQGTSIRGRVCADCLEMVGLDQLVVMDLHSPQIQGFFRQPVHHLSALPVFSQYLRELYPQLKPQDYVIVSPDAGFEKNARLYADELGLELAIGEKQRFDHSEQPQISHFGGESVSGKVAIIVDDFTVSGGTLAEAARQLQAQGATKVIACVSHALLNEKVINNLNNSPIDQLITSDTVDNHLQPTSDKIKIVSVAPFFAQTLRELLS